jgi:hypothetical protein
MLESPYSFCVFVKFVSSSSGSNSDDGKDLAAKLDTKKTYISDKGPKCEYDLSYPELVLTSTGPEDPTPQCVLCSEVLTNASMKHLLSHQKIKRNETVTIAVEFLQQKHEQMKHQQRLFFKIAETNFLVLYIYVQRNVIKPTLLLRSSVCNLL